MKEWINEEAVLTVDVGTGWISRYEAEGLTAGSIVRSSAEAGNPCIVRVNGCFFAQGSVAVVDGAGEPPTALLGAFLESFDEPENVFPRPARGDEATELLPFALRLNAVKLPFSSLEGAGFMSFVNLDRCADGGTDAELILAGIAVAEGKVVVIGENMGLRVTRLLLESPLGNFPRTTGSVLSALYNAESVKNYNFRMPDCFTKRSIQRTQEIHLEFLRGYESRFPESGGWQLILVDQLNYGEWLDDGARPEAAFLSFRPASRIRSYQREKTSSLPKNFLIESPSALHPLPAAELEGIRNWAAERLEKDDPLPFQAAFNAGSAALLAEDPGFEVGLACLRNGWLRVADLRIGLATGASAAESGSKPFFRGDKDRHGMILLARFKSESGGIIDIVYPENLLEPFLPALGR